MIEQLVTNIFDSGIWLWVQDGNIRYRAPSGALTPEFRDQIKTHRLEVIDWLKSNGHTEEPDTTKSLICSGRTTACLTYAQEQLWLADTLGGAGPTYNMPACVKLDGPLNVDALELAFSDVTKRHETLRSSFILVDGEPRQYIKPLSPFTLEVVNVDDKSVDSQIQLRKQVLYKSAYKPFDLVSDPLLRVTLLKYSDTSYELFLCMHHIISDGWSMAVFVQEIIKFYQDHNVNRDSKFSKLTAQFNDFATWQRGADFQKLIDEQEPYWKEVLCDAPATSEFPIDFSRPGVRKFAGSEIPFNFGQELSAAIETYSRQQGTTTFCVLLAALYVTLWRYADQDDLVVGTPIAGRKLQQTESMIGLFATALPLRSQITPDESFQDFTKKVSMGVRAAQSHQDVPLEKLIEISGADRDVSRQPLFQIALALENIKQPELTMEDVIAYVERIPSITSRFDITIFARDTTGSIDGYVEYDTALFESESMTRLMSSMKAVLSQAVSEPLTVLKDLPLMDSEEEMRITRSWNETSKPLPDSRVHILIEQQAEKTPYDNSLIYEGESLTYIEMNQRANQLAHYLRQRGVKPGVLVGLCTDRSFNLIIAILGILKAGGAYMPLDPNFPKDRLFFMIEDSNAKLILSDNDSISKIPDCSVPIISLLECEVDIGQCKTCNLENLTSGNDLFCVMYTSGSTGHPKGVECIHQGILNRLLWGQETYPLAKNDILIQKTPYSFDVSMWEMFWPLIVGAQLVIARPDGHKDPQYLQNIINDENVTVIHFVPSMLDLFLDVVDLELCQSLRQVICSGEALTPRLRDRFYKLFSCQLTNLYGPTEASIEVTYFDCKNDKSMTVPIGRPISNTSIFILDEQLRPVPPGVIGELHIGGVSLARGYLNRLELTEERFITPITGALQGVRMYKSGDRVRFKNNGLIEYLGRADHQIKLRGMRVELGEIESVLNQDSDISQAIVIAREDVPTNLYLVAYCVLSNQELDRDTLPQNLRAKLSKLLPSHMVPSSFVILDEFPLMHNGKINRKILPPPLPKQTECKNIIEPSSPIEIQIAEIWQELLGVTVVDVHDDFFDLGGNSLLVVRMLTKLKKNIAIDVPIIEFFTTPTIHALAQIIAESKAKNDNFITQFQNSPTGTPLFLVHPVGGHLMGYKDLLGFLNYSGSVYGIQQPDLVNNSSPVFRTIEELANQYVDAIQNIYPQGPYNLCGWSFGGLVILEIVKVFKERGQVVKYAGLIDSMFLGEEAKGWGAFAKQGEKVLPLIGQLSEEALISSRAILLNSNEFTISESSELNINPTFKAVFYSNLWAAAKYSSQTNIEKIYFYRASDSRKRAEYRNSFKQLQAIVHGNVFVRDFPADHYSLLAPPIVHDLAEAINNDLITSGN